VSLLDDIKNAAGRGVGELEILLHGPLAPHRNYTAEFDPLRNLWRGSWPDKIRLEAMKACGIQNVINFCAEREQNALVHSLGMYSINMPVVDETPPTLKDVAELLQLLHPGYWHCGAGVGRTGCFVAAYRVLVEGWQPQQALMEAITYGHLTPSQHNFILSLDNGANKPLSMLSLKSKGRVQRQ